MKTYERLSAKQKNEAHKVFLRDLLEQVCAGHLRFNDEANGDNLQAQINECLKKADDNQTPWFAHEYLCENSYIMDLLMSVAQASAEDALYSEPFEVVVPEPQVKE